MADDRVLSIVNTLDQACVTIEAELQQINDDLDHCAKMVNLYGDIFAAPLRYLAQLRENKRLRYKEIIGQLEALKTQLDNSSSLLNVLNVSHPLTVVQPQ